MLLMVKSPGRQTSRDKEKAAAAASAATALEDPLRRVLPWLTQDTEEGSAEEEAIIAQFQVTPTVRHRYAVCWRPHYHATVRALVRSIYDASVTPPHVLLAQNAPVQCGRCL
jgi:hypothetical protein